MQHRQNDIEITGSMLVSPLGDIVFDNPATQSHVAMMRLEIDETERTVRALTGWEPEALKWLKSITAAEWLKVYTKAEDIDVFAQLGRPEVQGWWRLQWHERDAQIVDMMTKEHYRMRHFHSKGYVQNFMRERYLRLHSITIFREHTYQYRRLEDTYARLF